MIETLLFLGFYVFDLLTNFFGFGTYLLLFFPYFLFLRDSSTGSLLTGALLAGMLTEQLHGIVPGSVLLGLGLSLLILLAVEKFVEWGHPVIRGLGFLFVLLFVFGLRSAGALWLSGVFHGGSFTFVELLFSWLAGSALVLSQRLLTAGLKTDLRGY